MSQPQDWNSQTASSYHSHPATPGMNTYSTYSQPAGGSSYGSGSYGSHYYPSSQMLSPPSTGHGPALSSSLMPSSLVHPSSSYGQPPGSSYHPAIHDSTGQVPPPGAKPRVTATLWEDEGTICFQVECNGLCVARREDNHFINGTKLLNVAGMTRGRRDGILKSEKTRSVVKIGPMHLKGVWIPFERALEFANREKITEKLYPLFVHNIGNLIPSSGQSTRGNPISRVKMQTPMHHPMVPSLPPQSSMQQVSSQYRPGLERSHTFPTPPTSASSVINSGTEYWNNHGMSNGISHASQPLNVDTGVSNARSMPSTPASTPPAHSIQSMSSFSHPNMSSAPQSAGQYTSQYAQPNGYTLKSEMAPPNRSSVLPSTDPKDIKQDPYSNGAAGEGSNHEQNGSYNQESGSFGNGSHSSYSFSGVSSVPQMPSMQGDGTDHMGSVHHDTATGQITPRASVSHESWTGYQTPPRSNTYHGSSNYPSAIINSSNKRPREDDEGTFMRDGSMDPSKRRKSLRDDMNAPRPGVMPVGR